VFVNWNMVSLVKLNQADPLRISSLVDAARFRGTCYRAANWFYVGQIKLTNPRARPHGREHNGYAQSIKDIYLYPLHRAAKQYLCGDPQR
jgi:hypothetical protein